MNNIFEKIDILFFERPLVDLRRYAFKIAKILKELNPSLSLASISLELPNRDEETYMDYLYLRNSIGDIDLFLKKHEIQVIVFSNPRIPDMEMMLHAHRLGIKTVMIQEGVIFEGANINDISLSNAVSTLHFIPKTLSYFSILHRMCKYAHKSYLGLIKKMLIEKHNITCIVAHYFNPILICDYVFTMGKHWELYYTSVMGYSKDQLRIMGDHDLDDYAISNKNEAAICYIATVLVEDGSRSREEFKAFLSALSHAIPNNMKLYIKLHPRSDIHLYDSLKEHNIEFVRNRELPCVTTYIGHRSTLLARALYESDNLIIWKFPKEKEDFFERFASFTVSTEKELIDAINNIKLNHCENKKRELVNQIYWKNPNGAIRSAANMILQYEQTGRITEED